VTKAIILALEPIGARPSVLAQLQLKFVRQWRLVADRTGQLGLPDIAHARDFPLVLSTEWRLSVQMKHNQQSFVTPRLGILAKLSGFLPVFKVLKRRGLIGNIPLEVQHQGMATAHSFMPLMRYWNLKLGAIQIAG
jgi:hypothetical protein